MLLLLGLKWLCQALLLKANKLQQTTSRDEGQGKEQMANTGKEEAHGDAVGSKGFGMCTPVPGNPAGHCVFGAEHLAQKRSEKTLTF